MRIKTIEKQNLVDLAENRILETVRTNRLQVGDRLPSEIAICEELGVSRTIVREALSRLRMLGLLESRKKRGLVLTEPDVFGGFQQVVDSAVLNEESRRDLFEMRLMLELGMAEFVFAGRSKKGLANLSEIADKIESLKETETLKRVNLDIKFHLELYRMSGNGLLLRFQSILQPFFMEIIKRKQKEKKGEVDHHMLLKELENGTPKSFMEAMRRHLDTHFETFIGK